MNGKNKHTTPQRGLAAWTVPASFKTDPWKRKDRSHGKSHPALSVLDGKKWLKWSLPQLPFLVSFSHFSPHPQRPRLSGTSQKPICFRHLLISFLICHIRTQYISPNQQIASDREFQWKVGKGEGALRNFCRMKIFSRLGGWGLKAPSEEGGNIPRNYRAFIFLPAYTDFSPSHLGSLGTPHSQQIPPRLL